MCAMPRASKTENMQAVVNAVKVFGRYEILDRLSTAEIN